MVDLLNSVSANVRPPLDRGAAGTPFTLLVRICRRKRTLRDPRIKIDQGIKPEGFSLGRQSTRAGVDFRAPSIDRLYACRSAAQIEQLA
jgi:hypothetical protein